MVHHAQQAVGDFGHVNGLHLAPGIDHRQHWQIAGQLDHQGEQSGGRAAIDEANSGRDFAGVIQILLDGKFNPAVNILGVGAGGLGGHENEAADTVRA